LFNPFRTKTPWPIESITSLTEQPSDHFEGWDQDIRNPGICHE